MPKNNKIKRKLIEKVHFSVTGEFLTHHCRDVWDSIMPKQSVETLMKGLQGMPLDIAMDIILGKNKLIGDSDNGIFLDDDNYEPLFQVDDIYFKLTREMEYAFKNAMWHANIKSTIAGADTMQDELNSWKTSKLSDYSEDFGRIDLDVRMKLDKKYKELLEQFSFLQSICPKANFQDMPPLFYDENELDIMEGCEKKKKERMQEDLENEKKRIARKREQLKKVEWNKNINCGWITPNGDFYPVEYGCHAMTIRQMYKFGVIADESEDIVEQKGWLKMSNDRFYFWSRSEKPTSVQLEFMSRVAENEPDGLFEFNGDRVDERGAMEEFEGYM